MHANQSWYINDFWKIKVIFGDTTSLWHINYEVSRILNSTPAINIIAYQKSIDWPMSVAIVMVGSDEKLTIFYYNCVFKS